MPSFPSNLNSQSEFLQVIFNSFVVFHVLHVVLSAAIYTGMSTLGGQTVQVNLVNELANIDASQVFVFIGEFVCNNTRLILNPGVPASDPSASWTVQAYSPPGVGAGENGAA